MTRPSSDDNPADRTTRVYSTGAGSTWRVPLGNAKERHGGYREKSLVLETALNEYRRLRREGQAVNAGDFCGRFPDYRKSLERLIDVEENLGDLGGMEDPFPVPGGSFLGFEILDELGVGAIARVYLATEPELGGRAVVIKVSADGTAEAATLGKLQHPNIVHVYSVKHDEASGMTAVCMPYQGSATLTDVLDLAFHAGKSPSSAKSILDVANRLADLEALRDDDLATQRPDQILQNGSFVDGIVHIGIQLAQALEYAHSCGVLHRDLKPSNVLLTPHGRPMLLDFNLSFDAERETMPRGGTLPYMAPEQIRSGLRRGAADASDMDPRCDVFSLGVILYELLTSKLPYGGPSEGLGPEAASLWQLNAHETPPQPIRELNPLVPASVAAAIERCLAVVPGQRFATLTEVAQTLGCHFSRAQRAKRTVRRHALLLSILAAVLAIAGVGTGVFLALQTPLHQRLYEDASAAYQRREYARAADLASQAIKQRPEFVNAILLRGAALWQSKNKNEATQNFVLLTRLAPSATTYDCLGSAEYINARLREAESCFRKALEFAPNDARLHFKLASALPRDELHLAPALEQLQRAIELDPRFVAPLLLRADLLRPKPQAAARDLELAVMLNPNSLSVRVEVCDQYSFLRPPASVKAEFEKAIRGHLETAVRLGARQSWLMESRFSRRYRDDPWYRDLVAQAAPGEEDTKHIRVEAMNPAIFLDLIANESASAN